MSTSKKRPNKAVPWNDDVDAAGLRDIVRRHKVRWQVWPHNHSGGEPTVRRVGYELELYGVHDAPSRPPRPGCSECLEVYHSLRRVAEGILPVDATDSVYELSVFDHALHYAAKLDMDEEVRLTIAILHKEGFDRPIDACEIACLNLMETRLGTLGATKGERRE